MGVPDRTTSTGLNGVTWWLLVIALALSVLHLTDHALRVDHSGWPFRPEVTPYTYSLLAVPMILFALFGSDRLYWWRWAFLLIGTLATLYAHLFIETPHMQYAMWANDQSADPRQQGFHNMLNVRSGALGLASMILSMTLNVTAVTVTIAMLANGLRQRGHPSRADVR